MKQFILPAVMLAGSLAGFAQPVDTWPAPSLKETGLYADWDSRRVGPEKIPFSPQYPLWTDGAKKTRWMELPPGTFIDASNPTIREGKKQGRGRDLLPPMPWPAFKNLSDDDLKSIYAFLLTVKPIKNKVPDPVIAPVK